MGARTKFFLFAWIAVIVAAVLYFQPPEPFSDRLAAIPEDTSTINNGFYDTPEFVKQWWGPAGFASLSTLQRLNPARIPYFDRAWQKVSKSREGAFLEIGCGGGIGSEALARLGYNMTGVDLSPNSIAEAQRHAAEEGVSNIQYKVGSAYELPFADESFDGVVMMDVLEHLHDLRRAVAEVRRVLKPNGVFAFDTVNRNRLSHIFNELMTYVFSVHVHDWRLFIQPEEMTTLLNEFGFETHADEYGGVSPVIDRSNPDMHIYFGEGSDMKLTWLGWARKPATANNS